MSRSLFAKLHRRFGPKLSGSETVERANAKQAEFMGWLGLASAPDCAKALPNGVAVVGGGFSGIAAAWTLGEAGVASTVFEARNDIGGRVESDRSFIKGRIIEAGAELIGLNHPMWLALAKRFGLGLVVFAEEDQYASAGLAMPFRLSGKVVPDPQKLYEQMAFVFRKISNDAKAIADPNKPWAARGASTWDAKSVADKVAEFAKLVPAAARHPMLVEAIDFQLVNDQVLPTKEQSYLGLLALVSGGKMGKKDVHLDGYWNDSEVFRCAEGNVSLAGSMLELGRNFKVHANSPVTKIEIIEAEPVVKVTWVDAVRGLQSKYFDRVILTAPPSVWHKIAITPALPAGMEMATGPAVKYISQVNGRFWIKAGQSPNGASDDLGQLWEATENQTLARQGIVLSAFAGGTVVPTRDAKAHFKSQILKLYPEYREISGRYVDWPNVEWIKTGYACPKVGQVTTIGKFLSAPHKKRMYFAGEHTSMPFFGYMEGALQSGARAAKAILDACSKKSGVHETVESVSDGNHLLDEAERALQCGCRQGRQSEMSFVQRLVRDLGGHAYAAELSPAKLFRSVLHDEPSMRGLREMLEVLAMPAQRPLDTPRPGDWMIRAAPGTGDVGHVSVLASEELLTHSMLASDSIAAESAQPGSYGLVIEAGAFPHRRSRPFARRLLDSRGRLPPHTMLLRPRLPDVEPAIELPPEEPEETFEDFDQFAEDNPPGGVVRPVAVVANPATIGFEFDLNIGLHEDVFTARAADMPSGATFPGASDKVTDHRENDGTGKLADGFQVKADGPRIEIATLPMKVDDDVTFKAVVKNVVAFARELEAERAKVGPDRALRIATVSGHPVRFTHPRTKINKFPLVVAIRGPQSALKWPTDNGVWAAPQATVTILLEHVGLLIDAIANSVGDGLGKALSGGSSARLGVRSDLVVIAKRRVLVDRARRIGTELSDKSKVSAADYSARLSGLLTLMTSYMLSGEIVDSNDYELFAKGYLPINVKCPFRDLFRDALSARERMVFKELYFNSRANFFALAKDRAVATDEDKELFPLKVRDSDLDRFHSSRLTWGLLLDNTVNDVPLKVTKANSIPKKNHALDDEVLWAPISSIIPFASTKPRVALELRRIGFAAHAVGTWEPLMKTVRALIRAMP